MREVRLERKGEFWQVDFLGASADEIMAGYGTMPLPHYIKRGENGKGILDAERYQTVYAEKTRLYRCTDRRSSFYGRAS